MWACISNVQIGGALCYMGNSQDEFVSISVGDKFSTIGEFPTKIQQVQQSTNVQLWNRDSFINSRRFKNHYPFVVAKANVALKYYSLYLACVSGVRRPSDKAS